MCCHLTELDHIESIHAEGNAVGVGVGLGFVVLVLLVLRQIQTEITISGELDAEQFTQATRTELHISEADIPDGELGRIFTSVDVDRGGAIDGDEFG